MKADRSVTASTRTSSMDGPLPRFLFASPFGLLLYGATFAVIVLVMMKLKMEPSEVQGNERLFISFFGGIGAVAGAFVWWLTRSTAYASQGKLTMCPSCRQWFSAVEVSSEVFNTGRVKAKIYSPKSIRDARSGAPIGYIDDYDDVDAIRVTKLTHWQCKRCGSKWITDEHARVPI